MLREIHSKEETHLTEDLKKVRILSTHTNQDFKYSKSRKQQMTRSLNKQDKLGQEGEKLGDEIRVNGEKHVHFINHRKNFE